MSYWSRLVNVFRGDRLRQELDEELQSHLEEAVERGRDPAELKRAFGSALRHREQSSDIRVWTWLDSLRADFVFGWRQLTKQRAASVSAILSLALAMGACTAVFRLIDALLLRPLPVANPDRLYVLASTFLNNLGKTDVGESFDYPQFRVLRAAVKVDAELIAISAPSRHGLTFGSDAETEHFRQQSVSGWMFSSFGLKPSLGRLLTPGDDAKPGASPVAVLSYDYWTRRFGRDPAVIGRKFRSGIDLYSVVGVCEKDFTGTDPGTITDVFVPTMMSARAIDRDDWSWFRIWVRLKPGTAQQRVLDRLRAAAHAYRVERAKTWRTGFTKQQYDEYTRSTLSFEPAGAGFSNLKRDYQRALWVLGAVVLLVLAIAGVNVANLMGARLAARAREMALRISIGAGRGRLLQLVTTECILMALLAGLLGTLFAWWAAPAIVGHIGSPGDPVRLVLPPDWRVLRFAAVLLAAVTLLFGSAAAWRASHLAPMTTMRGGDDPHAKQRLMYLLIGTQVAFCFLVSFTATLFVSTFERLSHQPTGFVADGLLEVETVINNNQPSRSWEAVRERLQTVRGVQSAAVCGWALMNGSAWTDAVWIHGKHSNDEEPYFLAVSPGWLHTMGIPLLAGRDFRTQDAARKLAIINQAFARTYFGVEDPLGRSFEANTDKHLVSNEIIGVAGDARYFTMRESIRPTVYVLFDSQTDPVDWATFMVRTSASNAPALASVLRRAVTQARSEFRVVEIRTQSELVEQQTIRERLLAVISAFLAGLAIVLSGIGLYGVLTYSLLQRRKELGIRIALGASRADVMCRLAAELGAVLLVGSAIGIAAGLLCQPQLAALLYQIAGHDADMLAWPGLTIGVAALLAALQPLRQSLKIDPAGLLRAE